MKKAFVYISMALLVSLLVFGCGHRSGNNPLGVTGGGDDGYGSLGQSSSGGFNGGGEDPTLVGAWRADFENGYELMTLGSSGNFVIQVYQNGSLIFTVSGTYSTNGNQITFNISGETQTGTYLLQGNTLSITIDGDTTVYTRVS